MKIKDNGRRFKATIMVGGETLTKEFPYDPSDRASRKAAKRDATYWYETRKAATATKGIGVPNVYENVSCIDGKYYLYLRVRFRRKDKSMIKSISVGRMMDDSVESIQAKRQTPKYAETLAKLRDLAAAT